MSVHYYQNSRWMCELLLELKVNECTLMLSELTVNDCSVLSELTLN